MGGRLMLTNPFVRLGLVLAFAFGVWLSSAIHRPVVSALTEKLDTAQESVRQLNTNITHLQAAQAKADELTLQLQQNQARLTRNNTELKHALSQATTGRACLSGSAVSLLNGQASTTTSTAAVSTPTSITAGADGAFATDTDIASWAADARTQYDTCRGRLNALIDWQKSTYP